MQRLGFRLCNLCVFILLFAIALPIFCACSQEPVNLKSETGIAAATKYARDHYNDGDGVCAEFCFEVLYAGGYTIPDVYDEKDNSSRTRASGQYNGLVNHVGLTSYYLGESSVTQNADKIEEGDLVFLDNENLLDYTQSNQITPLINPSAPSGHIVYISVANAENSKFCAHNLDGLDENLSDTGASGMWLIKTSSLLSSDAASD